MYVFKKRWICCWFQKVAKKSFMESEGNKEFFHFYFGLSNLIADNFFLWTFLPRINSFQFEKYSESFVKPIILSKLFWPKIIL
jgi:hypothetical protein